MSERLLQIVRRRIPLDRAEEYVRLWNGVRDACAAASANAWIFESAHVAGYYTEFVEWKGEVSFVERGSVADALDELNAVFIAEEAAIWTEAMI